ncbi:hypothetical protein ACWGOQ_0002700 [Aquimarina sp. M1]
MRKIVTIAFVLITSYGYSCSFAPSRIKEKFNRSNLIFIGKVVEISDIEVTDSIAIPFEDKFRVRRFPWKVYKFKVKELIKGDYDTDFIEIKVSVGNSCSKHFSLNETSLVFSSPSNYGYRIADKTEFQTSSVCSGTDQFKNIKRNDFKKLKRLSKSFFRRNKVK